MNTFWKIVAALMAMSQPVAAQEPRFDIYIDDPSRQAFDLFFDTGEWQLFKTADYCYASLENATGRLLVGYDKRRNAGHLGFWSTRPDSYHTGDIIDIETVFAPVIPGKGIGELNRDWGLARHLVVVNSAGNHVFNGKADGLDMLQRIGQYDILAFLSPSGEVMENFLLADSAAAMRRLRGCIPA